jgi:hypothetical protein
VSALEVLISKMVVPAVPVLSQTGPEVSVSCPHPFEGRVFLSQGLVPLEGPPYMVRGRAI